MIEKLKKAGAVHLICGFLFAVIGLCFLFLQKSPILLTVFIGITLSLFGLILLAFTVTSGRKDFVFAIKTALASVFIISGILVAIFNESCFEILFSLLSLFLIVDSSFKLQFSIRLKKTAIDGWWILTSISVLVIISSFILLKTSPDNIQAVAIWIGFTVLADFVENFLSALWSAKYKSAEKAEIYYEVFNDVENFNKQ